MARYKGKDGALTADSNDVGEVESFDVELSIQELAADVMGSDWSSVEAGLKTASGSATVLSDSNDVGQAALVEGAIVAMVLYPEGNTSGLEQISGDFLITSVSRSTSVNDLVKRTISFRNNGAVTVGDIA